MARRCCVYPDIVSAYLVHPVFKVKHCRICGEMESDCHPVLEKLFEWFIQPFWDGKVITTADNIVKR